MPESVQEVGHAVARLHAKKAQPVAFTRVMQELKLNRSAASRRLRSATDRGCLRDLKDTPISVLYFEDLNADQSFDGVLVVNPFDASL